MIENEYGSLTGPPKDDIVTTNMCISASLYNDPNPIFCINFGNINFVQKFVSLASLYMSFIFFLRRVISCLFAYEAVAVLLRIVCMKLMQERHRALARQECWVDKEKIRTIDQLCRMAASCRERKKQIKEKKMGIKTNGYTKWTFWNFGITFDLEVERKAILVFEAGSEVERLQVHKPLVGDIHLVEGKCQLLFRVVGLPLIHGTALILYREEVD